MKAKHRRSLNVALWIGVFTVGVGLVLYALKDSIVYYVTPTELLTKQPSQKKLWRLGGLVKTIILNPVADGYNYRFEVTDGTHTICAHYTGIAPTLFRIQQGVVAEGYWQADRTFKAIKLLIKHDETYRPPRSGDNTQHAEHSQHRIVQS